MAELIRYRVLRRHDGDKLYEEGDIREARDVDVKHLVPKTLRQIGPVEKKAEPAPLNKAEPAPANKAAHPLDHDANGRKGGVRKPSKGAK